MTKQTKQNNMVKPICTLVGISAITGNFAKLNLKPMVDSPSFTSLGSSFITFDLFLIIAHHFVFGKLTKNIYSIKKKRFSLNLAVKDLKTEIKKLPSLTRTVMFTWFFSISNKDLSFHHIKVFPIEF